MKTKMQMLAVVLLVCPVVSLFSISPATCATALDMDGNGQGVASVSSLSASLNQFGCDFYRELRRHSEENFVFSPTSIVLATTLLYAGASGATSDEIAGILHFPFSSDEAPRMLSSIVKVTAAPSGENRLVMLTSLFAKEGLHVSANISQMADERIASGIQIGSFQNEADLCARANQWASRATNGMISSVLNANDVEQFTRFVVMGSVYFKGKWSQEFHHSGTFVGTFSTSLTKNVDASFMRTNRVMSYYEDDDCQAIELPYVLERFVMRVYLPKAGRSITELETRLTVTPGVLSGKFRSRTEVDAVVPKFRAHTNVNMVQDLEAIGLKNMFQPTANFSRLFKNNSSPTYVSKALHNAVVEIDEAGTQAAAISTYVGRWGYAGNYGHGVPPIKFTADHPFVFVVLDNLTQSILFMGRIMNPVS